MNILVLCTGNSARSILLESLFTHLGSGRVCAFSAGSEPAGKVNPYAIALLTEEGHNVSDFRSKSWDEFGQTDAPQMDIVITVCGSAAAETCPIWPGTPLRAHWGVEDPAASPDDKAPAAFAESYDILRRRAEAFLGQTVETMTPEMLAAHLKTCGALL
ncbi:MAG: arsenate reductase ArsC [Sulfitobacter sp.]